MADSRYTNDLMQEVVTVEEIGAVGARVRTTYNSVFTVQWGNALPNPVPQVGEVWRLERIYGSSWAFHEKLNTDGYNMMRYAMELDIRTCIGRERSVIDDVASSGVTEVYLTVAEDGVVFWDSQVAEKYELDVCEQDGEPIDMLDQVVERCKAANLSVVFVIDCGLWSDTTNVIQNAYQQMRLDSSYLMGGWMGVRNYTWQIIENYGSWNAILNMAWRHAFAQHVKTWSFIKAKEPVKLLVDELYDKYSADVRGICFKGWCVDGAFADCSDYVSGEYEERYGSPMAADMAGSPYSEKWWKRREHMQDMFDDLQRDFLSYVKQNIGNWPVSTIVPSRVIFPSSEQAGRFDTWVDDRFGTFGWSMVGCGLDYTKSIDSAAELRSLEYGVACLNRLAQGSTPLFRIDVFDIEEYDGVFNILSKYRATNVLIDDYEHWRLLSDQQVIELKEAMNKYSVVPINRLDSIGFYLSDNSRDIAYHNERTPNRFTDAAQDMCSVLLDKLPHRIRMLSDDDIEQGRNLDNLSSVVLFNAENMSDEAIGVVNDLLERGDRGIVIIGICGRYDHHGTTKRFDVPFLDFFGERDFDTMLYSKQVLVRKGKFDVADNVFAMDVQAEGVLPKLRVKGDEVEAYGHDANGQEVPVPLYFNGRSSIFSIDITDNDILMDLASEMVLYAIGRDN